MKLFSYAQVGVTPGWVDMEVWFNGVENNVGLWTEVNAAEGWGRRFVVPIKDGTTELVYGVFKLVILDDDQGRAAGENAMKGM